MIEIGFTVAKLAPVFVTQCMQSEGVSDYAETHGIMSV